VNDLLAMFWAAVAGFVWGLISAVPVGPINVTIINEGARRGFGWAFLIGLGAGLMEMIYGTVGFLGAAGLFTSPVIQATFQLAGFLLMLYLGWHYYTAKSLPGTSHTAEVVERRLHPHTAFATGFVRVLGNPGVLLFWVAVSTTLSAHGWVRPGWQHKAACLAGVAVAVVGWVGLLSWAAARAHRRITVPMLLRLSRWSGVFLLAVALVLGVRLVLLLASLR
jgi:threonine/homoserine/homoserine lactone efflux protein